MRLYVIWKEIKRADERFTAYYDKYAPGFAAYYNEAIQHYFITRA